MQPYLQFLKLDVEYAVKIVNEINWWNSRTVGQPAHVDDLTQELSLTLAEARHNLERAIEQVAPQEAAVSWPLLYPKNTHPTTPTQDSRRCR